MNADHETGDPGGDASRHTSDEEKGNASSRKKKAGPSGKGNRPAHERKDYRNRTGVKSLISSGFDGNQAVPVVDGVAATEFDREFDAEPKEIFKFATPTARRRHEMRIFCLRHVADIEPRTFTEFAAEIGVTRAAVSAVYRDLLARIGSLRYFLGAHRRWAIAEKTKATWAKRRAQTKDAT